jgi:hypothetical protein
MAKCLYCAAAGETEEHVIPAAFGEFRSAPKLPAPLCPKCNNERLNLLDQQVARCGPEGFMREFYGIKGRAHKTKVNPFVRGSAGGSRLEFSTFDREVGVEVHLEAVDGVVTQMCELILVETGTGRAHHFPLTERTTADELRSAVARKNVAAPYDARLSCHPHEREWVEKLLQEYSPGIVYSEPKLMSHTIETPEVKFQLGERYFRGIAKIGFHYFLSQFPAYSGHESMFSGIRSFISEDTNEPVRRVNDFIQHRNHPLVYQMLNDEARPDGWKAHILAAEVKPGLCQAHVQMFLTKENPNMIYTVKLVEDPSLVGQGVAAHAYRYFPDGRQRTLSGEASPLPPIRVDQAFPPTTPAVSS